MATTVSKNLIADLTSTLENRVALNFLNDAINNGVALMGAIDSFVDEFNDATGIVGNWVIDQNNEAVTTIATGSSTSYVEVDGTEETAQSFSFTSTTPLVVAHVRLTGDNSTYPVDGDVFTLTIETDNSGAPSGTVLATATAKMVATNSTAEWTEAFTFETPFVPADTSTVYWMRLARTSGTGKIRVMWSSSVAYAGGNAWRTTGGADAGNDWTYLRFIQHTGAIPMIGTGVSAYDTTGDYLTNNTGGIGIGSTTSGWGNTSRTNSNASILLWPELEPGATVKSIWLYNNGNYGGDQNAVAYVVKWNGWGIAATVMDSLSQAFGTSGWKEFGMAYTVPDDGERYCLGVFFPSHWSSNTMTEAAGGGYYAYATESIINGGASITSTGLTQQGGTTIPPFWVEYEAAVKNITFSSIPVTADAAPSTARIVALYDDQSTTATLNTDIIFEVSRDGGTTWTAATMTNEGDYTGTIDIIVSGAVDISAQPSGTEMRVRARTLNTKEQRLYGWWLQWS